MKNRIFVALLLAGVLALPALALLGIALVLAQNGTLDLLAFVHLHKPDLIVYDLPRPYESHWNFLRLLKETDSLRAATWVLTTTDKNALEAAVGASGVVEIGEPGDVLGVTGSNVEHDRRRSDALRECGRLTRCAGDEAGAAQSIPAARRGWTRVGRPDPHR